MGLFAALKGLVTAGKQPDRQPELVPIGTEQSVCPYCGVVLAKRPSRKTKCPHCGDYIYVRTRPSDKKQVLVTEAQAEAIEEQWAIANGQHEDYLRRKQEYADMQQQLTKQFGVAPADSDVQWALLNKWSIAHLREGHMGLYRNRRLEQAEILYREKRLDAALDAYLAVCYLDLNGPSNGPGLWDLRFAGLIVVDVVANIASKLGLDAAEVDVRFMTISTKLWKDMKSPVTPQKAGEAFGAELRRLW